MQRLLCAAAIMALAGCVGVYDEGALPSAGASHSLATAQCDADLMAKKIVGAKAYGECGITADLAFVQAIKLHKMDLFEAYAARVRLAADQTEAGTMSGSQFLDAQAAARRDLAQQIGQAASYQDRQRMAAAAALAGMGQAMQNQAAINAINRPRTCTTTGFGTTATTTCY